MWRAFVSAKVAGERSAESSSSGRASISSGVRARSRSAGHADGHLPRVHANHGGHSSSKGRAYPRSRSRRAPRGQGRSGPAIAERARHVESLLRSNPPARPTAQGGNGSSMSCRGACTMPPPLAMPTAPGAGCPRRAGAGDGAGPDPDRGDPRRADSHAVAPDCGCRHSRRSRHGPARSAAPPPE